MCFCVISLRYYWVVTFLAGLLYIDEQVYNKGLVSVCLCCIILPGLSEAVDFGLRLEAPLDNFYTGSM